MEPRSPTQAHTTTTSTTGLEVVRRNGTIVPFEAVKIARALMKAFIAVKGDAYATSTGVRETVDTLTHTVISALTRRLPDGGRIHIEDIQDQVELALMRGGEHDIARAYVLYRERRAAERAALAPPDTPILTEATLHIQINGQRHPLPHRQLHALCTAACSGWNDTLSTERLFTTALSTLHDGVTPAQVYEALVMAARSLIEHDPDYSRAAAQLLLARLRHEILNEPHFETHPGTDTPPPALTAYTDYLPTFIQQATAAGLLDTRLLDFDLPRLAAALRPERDRQFGYLGLQTLYDRYFIHQGEKRLELPQIFFMRVAMGLAINEIEREKYAIAFYDLLSSFDFMCSTPTLFNSGTPHPQLSSCYLTTIADDLGGIFSAIRENALLQKYAGGLGNDWTPVRALGSLIRGTNGHSQGVIPFMKVANDTAVAVNQGGKRKGAVCAYLETWHLDIEEFLDLRKNTGDERRRTHDMNTAHWIPDLFMKRVHENGVWTLFSPDDVPDLHDKWGTAFETAYLDYEARAARGEIPLHKQLPAVQLWRRMLTMLFETGHPWLTFKDPCNLRSPQQHTGVIHSSNLCTEITLNTSDTETAVCNLGSINLPAHIQNGQLDTEKLTRTIRLAMRILDNVIDINYYPTQKARTANLRHRPVGLGIMGFADTLTTLGIPYASQAAVDFADQSMEHICHTAYWISTELAEERGPYSTFRGSLWDEGILPPDTLHHLKTFRGDYLDIDTTTRLDWDALRTRIARHGMRNANCIAIAPTATIANIIGVSSGIDPIYQNLYVKSNLSGEFTIINQPLVDTLKAHNLWDEVMLADLKYFDGSLARIERIPADIRERFATAFEIDPTWLVEAAARRQKWIDQAQSLNLYLAEPSGRKLDALYKLAWLRGLKTTYYLRTLGASQVEKTGLPPPTTATGTPPPSYTGPAPSEMPPRLCALDDPTCEACQ